MLSNHFNVQKFLSDTFAWKTSVWGQNHLLCCMYVYSYKLVAYSNKTLILAVTVLRVQY